LVRHPVEGTEARLAVFVRLSAVVFILVIVAARMVLSPVGLIAVLVDGH